MRTEIRAVMIGLRVVQRSEGREAPMICPHVFLNCASMRRESYRPAAFIFGFHSAAPNQANAESVSISATPANWVTDKGVYMTINIKTSIAKPTLYEQSWSQT